MGEYSQKELMYWKGHAGNSKCIFNCINYYTSENVESSPAKPYGTFFILDNFDSGANCKSIQILSTIRAHKLGWAEFIAGGSSFQGARDDQIPAR